MADRVKEVIEGNFDKFVLFSSEVKAHLPGIPQGLSTYEECFGRELLNVYREFLMDEREGTKDVPQRYVGLYPESIFYTGGADSWGRMLSAVGLSTKADHKALPFTVRFCIFKEAMVDFLLRKWGNLSCPQGVSKSSYECLLDHAGYWGEVAPRLLSTAESAFLSFERGLGSLGAASALYGNYEVLMGKADSSYLGLDDEAFLGRLLEDCWGEKSLMGFFAGRGVSGARSAGSVLKLTFAGDNVLPSLYMGHTPETAFADAQPSLFSKEGLDSGYEDLRRLVYLALRGYDCRNDTCIANTTEIEVSSDEQSAGVLSYMQKIGGTNV